VSEPLTRPLHLRLGAVGWVAAGGLLGAPARYAVSSWLPTPARGWPAATFVVNVAGAFVLGLLLEALARSGPDTGWRQRARLFAGTGFCGSLTTFSALAVETDLLVRGDEPALAAGYVLASLVAGLVAVLTGSAVAARVRPRR
jgi:CrcB protein